MPGVGFLKRHGIVRSAIGKDLLQFALPGIILWILEMDLCRGDALSGLWPTIWGLVKRPAGLALVPAHGIVGLTGFVVGLTVMCVGQLTLFRNYSGTVLIREGHQLVTHGIYRFTRNPMYLGLIMVATGLPVYTASPPGLLTSLVLIPLILNRIRLEEELLAAEFQEAYEAYKGATKRLIPFIY